MNRQPNGDCTHRDCACEAGFRVHWPGKTVRLCPTHARIAANLATHLGFDLTIDPLPGFLVVELPIHGEPS